MIPNSIAISRTDKIGDLILSIPSILMTRVLYPDAYIILLVNSYNYQIVKYLDIVNEIIKIDEMNEKEVIKRLQINQTDIFIALYTDSKIGRIAKKSGIKKRVAPLSKLHSYLAYNYGVKQSRSESIKNEAEYNLDLIMSLNKAEFKDRYTIDKKIKYSDSNKKNIEEFLIKADIRNDFIIISPFTGGSCKNLSIEEYAKLINKISVNLKNNVKIVIAASQDNKQYLNNFDQRKVTTFINDDDILNLAALIDKSSLFIGASTGTTHIAGNLRKRCVAIYPAKPTQSKTRWGLFGNDNNTLYIVPDEFKKNEDYSKILFQNITEEDINKYAKEITDYYNEK